MTQCPLSLTFTPLTLAEWNADAFVCNLPYEQRLVVKPQLWLFLKFCWKDFPRWGEKCLLKKNPQCIKTSKGRNIWQMMQKTFIYIVYCTSPHPDSLTICLNLMYYGIERCVHIPGPFELRSKAVVDIINI